MAAGAGSRRRVRFHHKTTVGGRTATAWPWYRQKYENAAVTFTLSHTGGQAGRAVLQITPSPPHSFFEVFPLQQIQSHRARPEFFLGGLFTTAPIGLLRLRHCSGMMAVTAACWWAVAISMTNVTSAGQFAGLSSFSAAARCLKRRSQLVINLRYALMSLSLSQKLERRVGLLSTACCSAFYDDGRGVRRGVRAKGRGGQALSVRRDDRALLRLGAGTLCGAVASGFLPPSVRSALSIAIYGMFIAIVVLVAKQSRAVLGVVALAVALSCATHWVPVRTRFPAVFPSSSAPCWRRALGAGRAGAGRAWSTGREVA